MTYLSGQTPPPDLYRTASGRIRSPQETAAVRAAYNHQKQQEAKFEELRRRVTGTDRSPFGVEAARSTKAYETLVTPTKSEVSVNKELLGGSNVGVFTFLSRDRCKPESQEATQTEIDLILCLDPPPGGGRQFSFRKKDYVPSGHADLSLTDHWFFGFGLVTQTILADLGDFPLADVNLKSSDLQYLNDFVPATTLEDASKQRADLDAGILLNGREFFSGVKAVENHTYILRSIAYRGEVVTVVNMGGQNIKLDQLENDKRSDVIVAFRVLSRGQNGDTRILWRTLQRKDSPKIKVPPKEVDGSQVPTIVTIVD